MSDTTKLKENVLKNTLRQLGSAFIKAGTKATAEEAVKHVAQYNPLLGLIFQQAEELGLSHLLKNGNS